MAHVHRKRNRSDTRIAAPLAATMTASKLLPTSDVERYEIFLHAAIGEKRPVPPSILGVASRTRTEWAVRLTKVKRAPAVL